MLRADEGNMKALFALAESYRAQGDNAKALATLDTAVSTNFTAVQPLMVRAAFYQELGDLPKAQADIERARAIDANNMTVGQSLATVLLKQHKYNQAVGVLNEMLTSDRTYHPAADLLLNAYLMQKDWNNVRAQVTSARARAMASRDVARQVELCMIESQMYRETGRTRESLKAMDSALALASSDVRVLARWLDAYVTAGEYDKVLQQMKARTGDAYRPLRLYEAAAMLGKNNVADANTLLTDLVENARGELIVILDYIGKYYRPADGLDAARQWASLRDEAPIHMFLGDMLAANQDIAEAERAYRKGLSRATTVGEALHLHGRLAQMLYKEYLNDRSRQEHVTKVVEAWRAVLELDPNNFAAMNNLAYIFTDNLDDPTSALPYAVNAANRDPQPDVLDTLGWTKARLAAAMADKDQRFRSLVAAAGILQQAYDLDEQLHRAGGLPSATITYHLGWTYEQLGDTDNAKKFYRYAELGLKNNEKDPLYAPVKEALERIKK